MKHYSYPKKNLIIFIISIIMMLTSSVYLIYSFYPEIEYRLFKKDKVIYPYETTLDDLTPVDQNVKKPKSVVSQNKPLPKDNRIVIPTIGVDVEIVEGSGTWALNSGAWRRPGTGDPQKGGNFVVSGHRFGFSWLPQDIRRKSNFFHLDKVRINDSTLIYWKEKEYQYIVKTIKNVPPTQVSIEDPTKNHILTVYTCSLLGRDADRLVLIAEPVKK